MADWRELLPHLKAPAKTAARRLLLDRQAEYWLSRLDPARSLTAARAKVVRVVQEAPDVKTFALRPNAHWRGFSAGQYVVIEAEIDGARARRVYSLSSGPTEPLLAITVKRTPGGRVSPWLHDYVRPGQVLGLGPAGGRFVLPEPAPRRLLFLSGGSGITPLMSLLRDLDDREAVTDVVLVHHARGRDGVIFRRDLDAIAARQPGLRLVYQLKGRGGRGGFDEARLADLVPDFAERETFLCGPPGLMERVEAMWRRAGASERLHRENFGLPPAPSPSEGRGEDDHRVDLWRSKRSCRVAGAQNLLDALERAGERLPSGCRMGICQTCTCRKRQGVVRNLITGSVSPGGDEEIQLCVSAPQSDLELDL